MSPAVSAVFSCDRMLGDSFGGTSDAPSQGSVGEIHAFGSQEWRREPKPFHVLIATRQHAAELANRETKERFPFSDKSPIGETARNFRQ